MSSTTPPTASPGSRSDFKITVLISGSGTNLQALIDACALSSHPLSQSPSSATRTPLSLAADPSTSSQVPKPTLPPHTSIVHVLSNRKAAYGLHRAASAHIPTTYHNLLAYKKTTNNPSADDAAARDRYDADLATLILHNPNLTIPTPDLIVCAGFMHVLSPSFLRTLTTHTPPIPIINLHPALPNAFNGTDAIARAWHAFQRGDVAGSGVMVHRVVEEVDMGEPLVVKEVEMRVGEGLSEFEERLHRVEWVAIVEGTGRALEEIGIARRRKEEEEEEEEEEVKMGVGKKGG